MAAAERKKLRQYTHPTGRPAIHIVLPAFDVYGHSAHQALKQVSQWRLEERDTLMAERNKRPPGYATEQMEVGKEPCGAASKL